MSSSLVHKPRDALRRYRPVVFEEGDQWRAAVYWGMELVWSTDERFVRDVDAYQIARAKATKYESTGED